MIKSAIYYSCLFVFLFALEIGESLSRPKQPKPEAGPEIKIGEIRFQVREFDSTPSSIKMLEVQIEIFNRSQQSPAPPNSIKVVVVPKEIKFQEGTPGTEFNPPTEETTLTIPLPPNTGRILIFGLQLPERKPESITFEIQINPPDGEKKTEKWEGGGN